MDNVFFFKPEKAAKIILMSICMRLNTNRCHNIVIGKMNQFLIEVEPQEYLDMADRSNILNIEFMPINVLCIFVFLTASENPTRSDY